ncbi:MFS transporter [Paenibacillus chitinolyticus]|uniref:MFS transporter n=1 Tax=Paenibacillus chitinolyticus TaxID=79263 RepID=UPI0026E4BF20|nr:MFS transporter [Paenibacillus chitinolyticus]GKS12318.1 MFS transporter [Paenibacillus chitinolyticus]
MKDLTTACTSEPGTAPHTDPRRWMALVLILLPTLLISLNNYMMQVALPMIQASVHAGFAEAQLIFSGYSLGLAVALILGGKLGDLYGRKRMLRIGVSGFTCMCLFGGLVSDPTLLIVIRIIQGLSAAMIQPQVLSIMQSIFLPREKGLVFAIYGAVIGIGFTLGLILGGFLVDGNLFGLSWRIVFLVNVPFGLLVMMGLPVVPESRGHSEPSIDWIGIALVMSGLFLLIYPLTIGQKQGWPLWIWGCLLLSLVLLLLFVLLQKRREEAGRVPLMELSMFKIGSFRIGIITEVVVYLSMFSFFFVLNYYLQAGLQFDLKSTSLVFLPIGSGCFATSLMSAWLVKRWGVAVLKTGMLTMGASLFILIWSLHADAVHFFHFQNVLILSVYGLGLGMATTPLANTILNRVPMASAGTGSGLFTTFMYLANALGVAWIGILFSAALNSPLAEAGLGDYIRAFSVTTAASGVLAFAACACICMLKKE